MNSPSSPNAMVELAAKVASLSKSDNSIDVLVEVALFEPDEVFTSIRANAAGTKVVYTRSDGLERTHWADEWTSESMRADTAAELRSRASQDEGAE